MEKAKKSGCKLPCNVHIYNPRYSYQPEHDLNENLGDFRADYVITLWFENYQFEHKKEFIVCDWTCLLGEMGGNFGFFLGGSVLLLYDLVSIMLGKFITVCEMY